MLNNLYIPPIFTEIMDIFYDQKSPNYIPKRCPQNTPENAFMNGYFYIYCVVKYGNHALGNNEHVKKSSWTQKQTQSQHYCKVIEGPLRI
jgi:hypothetical protein